jgi:hypothetical protein
MPNVTTIPNVELVKVGVWQCSTGEWTVTAADLASAVAAAKAGVIRSAPLKLGHQGPMRDAAPALGRVTNLRTTNNGNILVADFVDVPRALAPVLAKAYGQRSVEALIDYEAADGRRWPLVIEAVALLGAQLPAVDGLADVAALYGVAAAKRITIAASAFQDPAAARKRAQVRAVAAARRRRTHRITTIGVNT